MDVVSEAVSPGELDQVRGQLPADYETLFGIADSEQSPG